jgi:hypothetical protein
MLCNTGRTLVVSLVFYLLNSVEVEFVPYFTNKARGVNSVWGHFSKEALNSIDENPWIELP